MADSEKASTVNVQISTFCITFWRVFYCLKEVNEQLKRCGITKEKDVSELYLANRQVFVSFPQVVQLKNCWNCWKIELLYVAPYLTIRGYVSCVLCRGLEEVKDFEKYRNLQIVWLNGNKVSSDPRLWLQKLLSFSRVGKQYSPEATSFPGFSSTHPLLRRDK